MASDEKPTFTRDQLEALANLSPEQIKTLGKVGKVASAGTTRRNVLGALAGAGIGSAAGYSAISPASADASTTDGDGNIGTPSDPVDVFAEGVDANSVRTGKINGVYVAEPGEIQTQIDAAYADGGGTVYLIPGQTYDPGVTLDAKTGVAIDYNGATIAPTTDHSLWNVWPGTRILHPRNDFTGTTFTSIVFIFDTSFNGGYGTEPTVVWGGYSEQNANQGIVFALDEKNGSPISFVETFHHSYRFGTCYYIDSRVSGGYVNGNTFRGVHSGMNIGLNTKTTGGVVERNTWIGQIQAGGASDYGWHLQGGTNNLFWGDIWDLSNFANDAWVIGAGAGPNNTVLTQTDISPHTTDNKGDTTNASTYFSLVAQNN